MRHAPGIVNVPVLSVAGSVSIQGLANPLRSIPLSEKGLSQSLIEMAKRISPAGPASALFHSGCQLLFFLKRQALIKVMYEDDAVGER